MKTYSGVHAALNRVRGKASAYSCSCGQSATEWAYLHGAPDEQYDPRGAFSLDLNFYVPMCRRCHRLFDKEHITKCPQNHDYTPENTLMDGGKRKCKACTYERNRARNRGRKYTEAEREKRRAAWHEWWNGLTPEKQQEVRGRRNASRQRRRMGL